jgi:hypothetical protein
MVCLGKVGQRDGEAAAGVPVFVPSSVHRHVAPRPPNVRGLPLQHLRVGTTLHRCNNFVRQHEVTPPIVWPFQVITAHQLPPLAAPPFGYTLTLLCLFMFNSSLIMNMFIFNSYLNMNTCTYFISLPMNILLKYLFNCQIKIYRNLAYYSLLLLPSS